MNDYQSQVAVVTCAKSQYGHEIIKRLLNMGYNVAVIGIENAELEALSADIISNGKLILINADIANIESVQSAADCITKTFGENISILINNVGLSESTRFLEGDVRETVRRAKQMTDLNIKGVFNTISVFARYMVKMKYGRIVNITSVMGLIGSGTHTAYAATMAGVNKATESWGKELGRFNISISALAAGFNSKDAAMVADGNNILFGLTSDKVVSYIPTGRLCTDEDVAEWVIFMATCNSNYANSAVITLDGGLRVLTV